MSVTLTQLKQVLEDAVNTFVEQKLVLNPELNIRMVEDEILKLFETATTMTAHYKNFYARNYDPENLEQKYEVLDYLAEFKAAHCHRDDLNRHYAMDVVDALYKRRQPAQNADIENVKSSMIKASMLKFENSAGDNRHGIQAAINALSNIKSSNLKAELYVIKHQAAKMLQAATQNKDIDARRADMGFATGISSTIELAEHMLPYREATPDEILDRVNFPRPFFDFKGHNAVLSCPGLKQSVLFHNAIRVVEEFCSSNVELAQITANGLKKPLLGHFGRDGDSIMQAFSDGKKAALKELVSNPYLDEDRKTELRMNFGEMLNDVTHEMKLAFRKGALVRPTKEKQAEYSMG